MSRTEETAYRFRWVILIAGGLCLGGYFISWYSPEILSILFTWGLVTSVLVWLFVSPQRDWAVELAHRTPSAKRAIFSTSIIISCLSAVLLITLPGEAIGMILVETFGPWMGYYCGYYYIGICWLLWVGVFYLFWQKYKRQDMYTIKKKLVLYVLYGVTFETIILALIYALAESEYSFYAQTSRAGLFFGCYAMFWVYGTGLSLLFARKKYLDLKSAPVCIECGYDLRGSVSSTCPECGEAVPDGVNREIP